MLSESSSIAYSDHLDCRLETQQNTLAPAPFDPHSAIIIRLIIMWRLGLGPTLRHQRYPLFRSPLSNIILIYPPNPLNFLLRCYRYCLLHPQTSLIPRLAPFQYFLNVCSIIYTFNMIILAFEFFYSSSCGLVIACCTK
jgi:hypothetical protein